MINRTVWHISIVVQCSLINVLVFTTANLKYCLSERTVKDRRFILVLLNQRYCIFALFFSIVEYFVKSLKTVNLIHRPRGFNGSVNIPESCDFRSQLDPLNIICQSFCKDNFLLAYAF